LGIIINQIGIKSEIGPGNSSTLRALNTGPKELPEVTTLRVLKNPFHDVRN
jgi:hypothetical protein